MITIPNPCSENWDNMNKTEKGRFCNLCNKEVVDFSKMKIEKINLYFENNSIDDICGNFKTSQIDNAYKPSSKFRFIALFIVFISFVASSFAQKLRGKTYVSNKNKNTVEEKQVAKTKGKPKHNKSLEKVGMEKDTIDERPIITTKGPPKYIKPVEKTKIEPNIVKKEK